MSRKVNKTRKWKPSNHQQKLIETFAKSDDVGDITALCREAGVSTHVYYDGMKIPEFEALWETVRFQRFKRYGSQVDSAVIKAAIRKGKENSSMARIFYEKTGELTRDESPAPSTIVINISHE